MLTQPSQFTASYWLLQRFGSPIDLVFAWIPNYYFVKFAFIIWIYFPQTKGLIIIYTFLRTQVRGIFLGLESDISSTDDNDMKTWLSRFKYDFKSYYLSFPLYRYKLWLVFSVSKELQNASKLLALIGTTLHCS